MAAKKECCGEWLGQLYCLKVGYRLKEWTSSWGG
jgi:hypothetical protein